MKAIVVAAATLFLATGGGDHATEQKAAASAAESWLSLVDQGQYGKSWEQAAPVFRAAMSAAQWQAALDSVRKPLGKVLSRKLSSASYTTSLPGAPDGQYVVLQYETSFEHKKSAVETVTPALGKDGWKVSGYFIH